VTEEEDVGSPGSTSVQAALLAVVAAVAISGTAGCQRSSAPEKPRNVVLISIDTCRADRLGCYGHPGKSTPNVDAVARDGVTFLLAQTTNPITLPAHCSMMTGQIPPDHGVRDNRTYRLAASNVTLAEVMREHGYATAAFVGAFPLDSIMGLDQGFDVYDDRYTMGGAGRVANERRAMEVSNSAIEWLREHDGAPFFLFVHYFDPHAPYSPPEPFASEHAGDPYVGEIAYTDHAIGRVVDELKRLGLYDSSLIVITSAHGEALGEHEEATHAFFVYQSTVPEHHAGAPDHQGARLRAGARGRGSRERDRHRSDRPRGAGAGTGGTVERRGPGRPSLGPGRDEPVTADLR